MKDTDKIRADFEKWADDYALSSERNYCEGTHADCLAAYRSAYAQGQRDLIKALRPVGYMSHVTIRTISCGKPATAYPAASSWVKYPLYILPEHAQEIQDMGFLPEETPK